MAGPQKPEVAVVKGGQLRLVEPLCNRKDRGIHKPQIGVGVTVTEFADAPVVLGLQFLNEIGAGEDVVEKGEEDSGVKTSVD